jgi:heat shock protein HslJ
VSGTAIRLGFRTGEVSAGAGCNGASGEYRLDGEKLVLVNLSTTNIGCDAERHAQDEWLSDLLRSRPALALSGMRLTLSGGPGTVEFLDREVASPDVPLVGTRWTGNGYGDGQLVSGGLGMGANTLEFGVDGTVSVFTGCQQGTGTYATSDDQITFEGLGYDDAECTDASLEIWASRVRSVLDGSAVSYSIEEMSLEVKRGNQTLYYTARARGDGGAP